VELETTDTCRPLSCERNVPGHHETNIIQLVIQVAIHLKINSYEKIVIKIVKGKTFLK
jgi:hypothetical protein